MCHSSSVCGLTDKKHSRRKRAATALVSSGAAAYSVASTNNRIVNTPLRIISEQEISILEDQKIQYKIRAEDAEGDHLSFLFNETAPRPMGNVSLDRDGMLTYTPCADCYGQDTVYFTVREQRVDDDEPALSVEGKLVVKITNLQDPPSIQMFNRGHDVILPSSVTMVTMEENTGKSYASPDMVYILAAYEADYKDDVSLKFDPPRHGNLTLYRQVKKVALIEQDCSQPWDIQRPPPCGINLPKSYLVWLLHQRCHCQTHVEQSK